VGEGKGSRDVIELGGRFRRKPPFAPTNQIQLTKGSNQISGGGNCRFETVAVRMVGTRKTTWKRADLQKLEVIPAAGTVGPEISTVRDLT